MIKTSSEKAKASLKILFSDLLFLIKIKYVAKKVVKTKFFDYNIFMTKSKRNLIIIGSIVGVIVLFAILFGTLFSLKTIKVDFATTKNRVEMYTTEDIISQSKIVKGKNIVFADYSKNEQRLEQKFPYAEFNIVRVFPSTAIIYVYERKPVFRVEDEGFWYIFDEDLKCLEIVTTSNLELNNNVEIPVLTEKNLNLEISAGEFLNNNELKSTVKNIIDGVYGFEETPIDILSDIALSNDDILGTSTITMKIKTDGVTIVILGTEYVKEKIAYALYVYASDVSQKADYHEKLDRVTITVKESFTPEDKNNKIIVSDGTSESEE